MYRCRCTRGKHLPTSALAGKLDVPTKQRTEVQAIRMVPDRVNILEVELPIASKWPNATRESEEENKDAEED